MNHIIVFQTGRLWEFDTAREALKRAGVPHFSRQQNLSGLSMAFPAAPTPEIGVTWSLLVPEQAVDDAMKILKKLPIDLNRKPEFIDFTSDPKVKRIIRFCIYAVILYFALQLLKEIYFWIF
jgi:hypothetical protein